MTARALRTVYNLHTMPIENITPQFSKQSLAGEKQMVVWANLKKGGHAASHSHKEEQTFWVTSGRMELRIEEDRFDCPEGSVITVPSLVEHEATALEDTTFISFLSGVRADLLDTAVPKHFSSDT
jgi:quercetin dioxygenase-like cupin family protein